MRKKKLFKSIVLSAIAVLGLNFFTNSVRSVWMPTGEFHEHLRREAHRQYIDGMRTGYMIDSVANTGIDVSSYNPDVAEYWENLYELCRKIVKDGTEKSGSVRYRSTPIIFGDDEIKYWESVARYYNINIEKTHIYSMNQIPDVLRKRFVKIYEANNKFKTNWSLYPEGTKEQWLSIDINTRIKIAKIYAVSTYLDTIRIGLSKQLFSDIKSWESYDEIGNWVKDNVEYYIKKSKLPKSENVFNTKEYVINKIKDIISWPN